MLSVIMPLYNEGAHIFENIGRTAEVMRTVGPFELIAVNDGSDDDSRAEVDRAAQSWPEVRVLHLEHGGKGEALRQGAQAARGEFVIFIDSDLDLPPEQILFFLALQKAKKADAVIGSKMHPDSTVEYPLIRRFYSGGYFVLTKFLFGLPVRDTQTGLKLVRRTTLLKAMVQSQLKGFAFDLELLVLLVRQGAVMVEAPVVVYHQVKFGGVGWKAAWSIARETVTVWRRFRGQ
jgi:glycosyltransferase involved in cell wall biosynthesis